MYSLPDEFEYAGSATFSDAGAEVTSEYFNCITVLAIFYVLIIILK
jgi:hypothetical protein